MRECRGARIAALGRNIDNPQAEVAEEAAETEVVAEAEEQNNAS